MKSAIWKPVGTACLSILLTPLPWGMVSFTSPPVQAQEVPAVIRQGYTLLGQGRVNEAIAAFERAVRQFPQSPEAWLGLGITNRRAGRDGAAFQAYEQVLRLDPNNPLALRTLGLLGGYRPEWQNRGIETLSTLLRLNPNDGDARKQRALLYTYQGRFPEAIADYQILLRQTPTPEVILAAAQAYTYNNNYPVALQLFNQYQQFGGSITGYAAVAYGRTLRNLGELSQAVRVLNAQLTNKTDDLNTQVRVELAQTYLAAGQAGQALAILDPIRNRPGATLPLARALNELGQKLNSAPLRAEAVMLYRQALSQTPNPSPALLREGADVLSGIPTQREFALQLYRQIVQLEPNDRRVQLKRLALERQLGYISRAQLRSAVFTLLQPFPATPNEQQNLAEGLVPIEPELFFLPFYQALLQNPEASVPPFLNFRAAQLELRQRNRAGARNALAAYTATPQAQGDLAPQLLAAEIERQEGNLEAAAQRYQAVIAANPTDYDLLTGAVQGLAATRNQQGRTGEALLILDQLIVQSPQDMRVQMVRTAIAYQAQVISLAQAETVLNRWLASRPPTDMPGELYTLVAALPPAPQREPLYEALAQDNPSHIPVQVRLIQVIASRDRAEAQRRVIQLVAQGQRSGVAIGDSYLLQGELSLVVRDIELAESSFESALALEPDSVDALMGLAAVRSRQQLFDQAEQLYNRALAFTPGNGAIQRSLIEVKVARDSPLEAIGEIEQLQRQQPGGIGTPDLNLRRQKIEEDFLLRRGFQPPWERY